jgi:hypothetical protein
MFESWKIQGERKKERKLPGHRNRESLDGERNINLATEKEIE